MNEWGHNCLENTTHCPRLRIAWNRNARVLMVGYDMTMFRYDLTLQWRVSVDTGLHPYSWNSRVFKCEYCNLCTERCTLLNIYVRNLQERPQLGIRQINLFWSYI
jgi:hypothetical protein